MTFIAGVFGVPSDEAKAFAMWESAMLTGTTKAEVEDGANKCFDFAVRMIELKRREPGDDLFTKLLNARGEGALDDDELTSTFIVLMVGAGEPANAICSGFALLLSHPEYMAAARESEAAIPRIVEEILRVESPFRMLPPRFSEKPTVLDDLTIPAGELIAICPASANRDPAHFRHPDSFDPSDASKDHLAFGDGVHKCLGALLAKMEIEEAIRAFVAPCSEIHLDTMRGSLRWRPGDFMRRLDRLIVTVKKSA